MKTEKKMNQIIRETYSLLYSAATPSCDFEEMIKHCGYIDKNNADLDIPAGSLTEEDVKQMGIKIKVPYNDYTLDEDKFSEIMESQIERYKLTKMEKEIFKFNIYLGCSPRTVCNYGKDK